jgi:short-subunit dehydrogenase
MDPERLDAMIQLNVAVATRLARAVAPGLAQRRRGDIISIASVAGIRDDQPAISVGYSASKAYVLAFSEGLDSRTLVLRRARAGSAARSHAHGVVGKGWDRHPHPPARDGDGDGDMVDAALAGLEQGERVTIPALPDIADWTAFKSARAALGPNLSRRLPADRYSRNSGSGSLPKVS